MDRAIPIHDSGVILATKQLEQPSNLAVRRREAWKESGMFDGGSDMYLVPVMCDAGGALKPSRQQGPSRTQRDKVEQSGQL